MSEEQQRKERVNVNLEIFDEVQRLYTTKYKQELLKITTERLKFVLVIPFFDPKS